MPRESAPPDHEADEGRDERLLAEDPVDVPVGAADGLDRAELLHVLHGRGVEGLGHDHDAHQAPRKTVMPMFMPRPVETTQ